MGIIDEINPNWIEILGKDGEILLAIFALSWAAFSRLDSDEMDLPAAWTPNTMIKIKDWDKVQEDTVGHFLHARLKQYLIGLNLGKRPNVRSRFGTRLRHIRNIILESKEYQEYKGEKNKGNKSGLVLGQQKLTVNDLRGIGLELIRKIFDANVTKSGSMTKKQNFMASLLIWAIFQPINQGQKDVIL